MQEEAPASWLPEKIGAYTILGQIGQGGMGVVYEAEQESPRRRVAIKLLHPMHATPESLRRFRREAQLLGLLRHPGIAQIIEASTYDLGSGSQPFFAMELVDGLPLTDYAGANALGVRARLGLIAQLCDVLEYAHAKGVVHRDLKPANILVTTQESSGRDGRVDTRDTSQGRLRILDFGIARATDSDLTAATLQTSEGQLVGTISYMSPEQASGEPETIDGRSDVYAVGVLAYELLAGHLPLRTQDKLLHEAVRVVREDEPSALGTLERALRGDVETIVAKALEKEKERRYPSAADMAADIRRHLADQPIEARSPSTIYQLKKFTRRNKALVGGVAATLLVAVTGAIVAAGFALEATARAAELERSSYVSGLAAAASALEQGDHVVASLHLDKLPLELRGWEYDHLRARLEGQLDEWSLPSPIITPPVFDSTGRRMFAVMLNKELGTWDLSDGRLLDTRTLDVPRVSEHAVVLHGPTQKVALAPDHRGIVVSSITGGEEQLLGSSPDKRLAYVLAWDEPGQQLLWALGSREDPAEVFLWDGARSRALGNGGLVTRAGNPLGNLSDAVFNHSGDRIALVGYARSQEPDRRNVWLLDSASGDVVARQAIDDTGAGLAFSPDDRTLAVMFAFSDVYLLDGRTLEIHARLEEHRDAVEGMAWNRSGSRLVTTSMDGTLRIRNAKMIGKSSVVTLDVVPETRDSDRALEANQGSDQLVSVAPDDEHVLVVGPRVQRFPLEDSHVLTGHDSYVYYLAFSTDGSLLASVGYKEAEVLLWDVEGARLRSRHAAPGPGGWDSIAPLLAFSEDDRRLVAASSSVMTHWDLPTGGSLPVSSQADLRDRWLETLDRRSTVRLTSPALAVSHDGEWVAVCRESGVVELFETIRPLVDWWPERPGTEVFDAVEGLVADSPTGLLEGHIGQVYCAAFSPDGTRIATGGRDASVRIWDARTFEQLLVLRGHKQYVKDIAFSPDGTLLASASGDKTIRLWDTRPLHERRALNGAKR